MKYYPDTLGVVLIWKNKYSNYLNSFTDSLEIICKGIQDYLSGTYPFSKYKFMERTELQKHKYGIEINRVLADYCKTLMEGKDDYLDYRMFDLLYQHKKVMAKRILFMLEKEYLLDDFFGESAKIIERQAVVIRNIFIKYSVKPDQVLLLKIITKLDELNKCEVDFYEKLLEKIIKKEKEEI